MFTVPPTPEEFIELRKQKFIRLNLEKVERETRAAAEMAVALEKNNKYQIKRIIQAMNRGDDQGSFESRMVQTTYTYGDVETARLNTLFTKAFPLFDMTVTSDPDDEKCKRYEVRWFVKATPKIKDDNFTHLQAKEWMKNFKGTFQELSGDDAKEWMKIYHKAL
jgi:hypothetical protein